MIANLSLFKLINLQLPKTMNKQQQLQSYEQIQQYLQNNNISGLFNNLIQQIILQQPNNVLDFVIKQLQSPQKLVLFIVGPPGLSINSIMKQVLTTIDNKFALFNCGEQISKKLSTLQAQDKDSFNSLLLIQNEGFMADILKSIEQHAKSEQSYIIQGFPKNLKQAQQIQARNIYAKNVLFINIDLGSLYKMIYEKLSKNNPQKSQQELQIMTRNSMSQHNINMNELKKFYKQYLEIDLSQSQQESYISQQLMKAFNIKTIQQNPRISSQIIILGAPCSGRTTLGQKIAQNYNLVYISTSFLIAQQIRKDTIHGRKIKPQYANNQMIDTFLIQKLIQERIASKDCKMQGFVIEGYPKNKQQYQNIKNMKLSPTMIVAIDSPIQHSYTRITTTTLDKTKFAQRYAKWNDLSTYMKSTKDKIFWINPYLSILNMYEEVIHEVEKSFW